MAKFKLYLMSLRGSESEFSPRYSLMPISEFNTQYNQYDGLQLLANHDVDGSQYVKNRGEKNNSGAITQTATAHFIQDQSFTYTSNEKFQIHQNSQRSLSFTMYRNIIRADRIEVNPFINYLFVGAQLLLIDKYDKHHLMTVSKISYKFNELNTEFSYECQDSFSYQLSRQNTGYEIENNVDGDTSDFIGAQQLDWWVLCKIHPECKIPYQYLKLNDSRSFKKAYIGNQYDDYYRTVPFSGSGTANSVLIALGELYGLQLNVYERVDINQTIINDQSEIEENPNYGLCEKYYGFSPVKSLQPTGLKYSPYGDLQSFTLEHTGNSFASILNIQSNTIGDEIITAIPSVPNFFRQWFETEEWRNSSFYAGLFSSACQEHVDYVMFDGVVVDPSENTDGVLNYTNNTIFYKDSCLYIPIKPDKGYTQYDLMQFSTNGGAHSKLTVAINGESTAFNSKYNSWKMIYKLTSLKELQADENQVEAGSKESVIPYDLFVNNNDSQLEYFYLVLTIGSITSPITIMGDLYISQYRIPTTEELEFAAIADRIPWLENKLISFDYFYEHSIINASEYSQLMRLLENDLRKVNAKLLYYSQQYYKAIQNKTIILGKLSAKLDLVGATFQADIINPYLEDGRTTKTTDFVLAMSDLWANSSQTTPLLSYYETLTDYVNKYYNAEQTFLKNMYLFNNYFNAKTDFGTLYEHTFTIDHTKEVENGTIVSFTTPNKYISLNEENQHQPFYEKTNDGYQLYNRNNIVDENNLNRFCYLDPQADNMNLIEDISYQYLGFNDEQQYYELAGKVKVEKGGPKVKRTNVDVSILIASLDDKKFELELLSTDENGYKVAILSCYMHCLHTKSFNNNKLSLTYKDEEGNDVTIGITIISKYYKPVDYTALRTNFFYQQLNNNTASRKLRYIYRKKTGGNEMLCNVQLAEGFTTNTGNRLADEYDYNYSGTKDFKDLGLNPQLLLQSPNSKNGDSDNIDEIKQYTLDNYKSDSTIVDVIEDAYKENFPLTSGYWYGKSQQNENGEGVGKDDYHQVSFVNIENCSQFYRRISTSQENRAKGIGWGSVFGLSMGASLYGHNGAKDFGNDGGTYHDALNCTYGPCFGNDGWSKTTKLMYISNPSNYDKTSGRDLFPSECYHRESPDTWCKVTEYEGPSGGEFLQGAACYEQEQETDDNTQVVKGKGTYGEATTMLLTYYSFNRRLRNADKIKYHYSTKYWRILTKQDCIGKNDSLQIILAPKDNPYLDVSNLKSQSIELTTENGSIERERISTIVYYPLNHVIVTQSLSELKWPDETTEYVSLGTLLDNNKENIHSAVGNGENEGSGEIKLPDDTKLEGTMIFVQAEDFNYEDITNIMGNNVGYNNIGEYASASYYDNKTNQPINLITQYPEMTVGFYVASYKDEDYLPATLNNTGELDNNLIYYEKLDDNYERRYTITQIIDQKKFYVKLQDEYKYCVFGDIDSLSVNYFVYTTDTDGNTSVQEEVGTITIVDDDNAQLIGPSLPQGLNLTRACGNTDLNNCTNGWFGYNYNNNVEKTVLMEKAMVIETNLTEYGTNAYYASKNCKYFLPEYGQPTVNQKVNHFSGNILCVTGESAEKGPNNIQLSSRYVPNVIKLANQPKYQFRHRDIVDSLATTRALQYGLNVGDTVMLSSVEAAPIQNMMNYLNLPVDEGMATKLSYGDNVVYQHNGGGTLGTDALITLTSSALQYDQFGGGYDMMIRVLQTCNYCNYNPIQYRQAQEEHDAIWRQIYTKYPNLIYEQAYTNEDATTSQELLTMAQWAFKDYNQPESNYNISVIDSNTLKGYRGQELAIGDGIEVNATELYDDAGSDIYKSLIQYLYITDISYDLRQDDSIQLTVNSIKYRDKVIGELVKLIR